MELLAFVHTAVIYEDPTPDPEVTLLNGKSLSIPSSAGVALAGVAMAVAAVSASPNQAVAATTAIGQGSSGEAVTNVQKALGIEADGQFGVKTEAAVTDFQIRHGLKQVDGVVGKETATALGLNEAYKPVELGYVDTYSNIGLNVRSGPGIDYRRIGGLEEGTVVDTYGEVHTYSYDDYYWQRVGPGEWVATDYIDYDYHEVSYPDYDCYEEVSYHHDYYYDDYYYSHVSYSDGGGYVHTRSGIGLNIRSGPGLDYAVEDAVGDGTYLPSVDGTVYNDGYAWEQLPDGSWFAANYVY